jgi:hypothetical protein
MTGLRGHKRSLAFEVENGCLSSGISTPPGWDEWPLDLAVTHLSVFSMLCRIAAARFLNN